MANQEVTTTEIMEFLKENMVTKEEIHQIVESEVSDSQNEIMEFLKEHMLTKEEAFETFVTNEKHVASESRIIEHVDRFAKLHETLDQELVMLRSKYSRLEERLEFVEAKLGIAA